MVRHIVMWKFREGTQEQADEFLHRLAALNGVIPCIRAMQVLHSAEADSAYDAVLIADFDSLDAVKEYKDDPRHRAVSALCKEIRTDRRSIDVAL